MTLRTPKTLLVHFSSIWFKNQIEAKSKFQFGTKKFHAEPTGNPVSIKCQIGKTEGGLDTFPDDQNPMYWFWYDLRGKPDTSPEPDAIANISNFRYVTDLPSGDWTIFGSKLGIQPGFQVVFTGTKYSVGTYFVLFFVGSRFFFRWNHD